MCSSTHVTCLVHGHFQSLGRTRSSVNCPSPFEAGSTLKWPDECDVELTFFSQPAGRREHATSLESHHGWRGGDTGLGAGSALPPRHAVTGNGRARVYTCVYVCIRTACGGGVFAGEVGLRLLAAKARPVLGELAWPCTQRPHTQRGVRSLTTCVRGSCNHHWITDFVEYGPHQSTCNDAQSQWEKLAAKPRVSSYENTGQALP
jgi:hypothetical protein